MNNRAFKGIEEEIYKIKDRWFHYFGFLILSYDLYRIENFGNIVDILTDL